MSDSPVPVTPTSGDEKPVTCADFKHAWQEHLPLTAGARSVWTCSRCREWTSNPGPVALAKRSELKDAERLAAEVYGTSSRSTP